jgi:hypothetical protein
MAERPQRRPTFEKLRYELGRLKVKRILLATAFAAIPISTVANAGVLVLNDGSAATYNFPAFATPANSVFFNFNAGDPSASTSYAGFIRTGGLLLNGDTAQGAAPETFGGAASQYLSTTGGASTTIAQTAVGFDTVSFFLGSIDSYNTVNILSTTGALLASFSGTHLSFAPNGNQELPITNRRATFTRSAGDAQIGGVSFASGGNSLEVDNLVFTVPEPATWAMMIAGFGMIGFAVRSRRRIASVVYA